MFERSIAEDHASMIVQTMSATNEHDPILSFFTEVRDTHLSGIGVKETSYYPYLSNLFNDIGKLLKPKVRCIIHPHNIGAGLPDGALVTPDQKSDDNDPLAAGLIPSRGVLEIKPPSEEVDDIAATEQVSKYLATYGLVLVTNLRDFLLVGNVKGKLAHLERFTVAADEKEFWKAVANPAKLVAELGPSLKEYLLRVLLQKAPLTAPRDVAWFLASYARDAKLRIESKADLPGLASLRAALEQALGLTFDGEDGEKFFRSSLVQTLFYGVFSAWVLWSKRPTTKPSDTFNWHEAQWSLHVPMIRTLFEQLATPTKLQNLGLEEILNWTEGALNRVDRDTFFKNFEQKHAVQYFYEPFLAAFDPDLRKRMGVWFTPPEIVKYMVSRIDRVLRDELGIANGFADPNVFVLDPSCGTGAFLVEVLLHIDAQLKAEGADALSADDVKAAAMERIFGFELLPAPFVVAHLQLGLLLQDLGAPLAQNLQERVAVYLTNSLTGWHPQKGPKQPPIWPELEEEKDAAELVKREKQILVVLGNPPYYAFSGVSPQEEQGLVEPYKGGLISEWNIKKFNLDELYVRFLRLAERRIAEMSKRGIVCYVSSYSYLSDPSFVVVRKRFLSEFQHAWIDCLNGDSRETGKRTPDGQPDPSVFSTEYNRAGIRLGTAVGLFAKTGDAQGQGTVRYRDFWGTDKRAALLKTLEHDDFDSQYTVANPDRANRFSFRPTEAGLQYQTWPMVTELAEAEPISGLQEMRRGALISHDRTILEDRIEKYLDPSVDWASFAALNTGLSKKAGRFKPSEARKRLQGSTAFDKKRVMRYALLPLDDRWAYHSTIRPLWNEPRPELLAQRPNDESFFIVRRFAERPREGKPGYLTTALPDYHLLRPNAVAIPLRLSTGPKEETDAHQSQGSFLGAFAAAPHTANLSLNARKYLKTLTDGDPDTNEELGRAIWLHSLAIVYSPLYLSENNSGIRSDLPRIPMPDSLTALESSASLGAEVGKLLETEKPVPGVTAGKIRKELSTIGRITGPQGLSLAVTADWGRLQGEDQVVMPGNGSVKRRDFTDAEKQAIEESAAELGSSLDDILNIWGGQAVDVYLNGETFWSGVPASVWDFTIGGYLVLKKWLSYREHDVLGRDITKDEAREFTQMARRLAALLLLDASLDANYLAVKGAVYAWPSFETTAGLEPEVEQSEV